MRIFTIFFILMSACAPLEPSGKRPPKQNEDDGSRLDDGRKKPNPPTNSPNPEPPTAPTAEKRAVWVQLRLLKDNSNMKITYMDVKKILDDKCVSCHEDKESIDFRSYPFPSDQFGETEAGQKALMKSVMERLKTSDTIKRMPFGEAPLKKAQIQKFQKWIDDGLLKEPEEMRTVLDIVGRVELDYHDSTNKKNTLNLKYKEGHFRCTLKSLSTDETPVEVRVFDKTGAMIGQLRSNAIVGGSTKPLEMIMGIRI